MAFPLYLSIQDQTRWVRNGRNKKKDKNLMTIIQTTSKSVSSTPVRRPLVFYVALHRSRAVFRDEIVSDAIGTEGMRIECG